MRVQAFLYVFTHSLTISAVSFCHSRFSLSVIPDNKYIGDPGLLRESRILFHAGPHE